MSNMPWQMPEGGRKRRINIGAAGFRERLSLIESTKPTIERLFAALSGVVKRELFVMRSQKGMGDRAVFSGEKHARTFVHVPPE